MGEFCSTYSYRASISVEVKESANLQIVWWPSFEIWVCIVIDMFLSLLTLHLQCMYSIKMLGHWEINMLQCSMGLAIMGYVLIQFWQTERKTSVCWYMPHFWWIFFAIATQCLWWAIPRKQSVERFIYNPSHGPKGTRPHPFDQFYRCRKSLLNIFVSAFQWCCDEQNCL